MMHVAVTNTLRSNLSISLCVCVALFPSMAEGATSADHDTLNNAHMCV